METFLKKKETVVSGNGTLSMFDNAGANMSQALLPGKQRTAGARESSSSSGGGVTAGGDKGNEYLQKCRALKIRGRILRNEMEDTQKELKHIEKQVASSKYVMKTLLQEEEEALEKLRVAQEALELVRQHKEKHTEKVEELEKAKVESIRKLRLIQTTVGTIEQDADKAFVLLQNFCPGAKVEV